MIDNYPLIQAKHWTDSNRCFYCGCEAGFSDIVPPVVNLNISNKRDKSLLRSAFPACGECHKFLKECTHTKLKDRKTYVNQKIEDKYKIALGIYHKWSSSEARELSYDFEHSIMAGIRLGSETASRLKYRGFEFEQNQSSGEDFKPLEEEAYSVNGVEFQDFRAALQYTASQYYIEINELLDWLEDYEMNFDRTVDAYQNYMKSRHHAAHRKNAISRVVKEHGVKAVKIETALKIIEQENNDIDIEEALQKIVDKMKKPETRIDRKKK